MGIQNSINSMLGSAAAGAVAAEHIAKEKEQSLLAQEQYHEAKSELPELDKNLEAAKSTLAEAEGEELIWSSQKPGGRGRKGMTKEFIEGKRAKAISDREAAERAFDELTDKIEAKKAMMSRAEAIMKRTSKWGGIK